MEDRSQSGFHGERLRAARLRRGWTQVNLADQIGGMYDQSQISALERERVGPVMWKARVLAETLGVSVDWLMGADTEPWYPSNPTAASQLGHAEATQDAFAPEITIEQLAAAGPGEQALSEYTGDARYVRLQVTGDSMESAGIADGDWLIFDRQKQWPNGEIVVAALDGRVYVKWGRRLGDETYALFREPGGERLPGIPSQAYKVVQVRRNL